MRPSRWPRRHSRGTRQAGPSRPARATCCLIFVGWASGPSRAHCQTEQHDSSRSANNATATWPPNPGNSLDVGPFPRRAHLQVRSLRSSGARVRRHTRQRGQPAQPWSSASCHAAPQATSRGGGRRPCRPHARVGELPRRRGRVSAELVHACLICGRLLPAGGARWRARGLCVRHAGARWAAHPREHGRCVACLLLGQS